MLNRFDEYSMPVGRRLGNRLARRPPTVPVVIVLPLAYQDGVGKYDGIMRYIREADLAWDLRIIRENVNIESFWRNMPKSVAGVICGTAGRMSGERKEMCLPQDCLDVCRRRRIPLVGLDWPLNDIRRLRPDRCSFLNIDSEHIGTCAAQHVLRLGNFAAYGFFGLYPGCAWARDRGAFFARGIRKVGRRNVRLFKGNPWDDAAELEDWLVRLQKPAAVFASNDCAAEIVLKACNRIGLRVPEELAVLGVDDDPILCVNTWPTLSSVRPDFEEMGYRAAEELDRLLNGTGRGSRLVVAGQVTVTDRMSTAPSSPVGMMIRRADEIIAARACQDLTSEVIADELNISRRLLDLRYRQINGISVREAIVRRRMERARQLLSGSRHSLRTVGKLCGYTTEQSFCRAFLKHEGLTAGAYRRRTV